MKASANVPKYRVEEGVCNVVFSVAGKSPAPVTYIPPDLPENADLLFENVPHSGINFEKYDEIPVEVTGVNPPPPIQSFEQAGMYEQCAANIRRAKFPKPTPVQKYTIPIVNSGRDLMACAQTGSGKTVSTVRITLLLVLVAFISSLRQTLFT